MATATKREVTKTRVIEEKYEEVLVNLELSEEEAFTLVVLLNRAGGAPSGPRGTIDKIRRALEKSGFAWDTKTIMANSRVTGYPIFPDAF